MMKQEGYDIIPTIGFCSGIACIILGWIIHTEKLEAVGTLLFFASFASSLFQMVYREGFKNGFFDGEKEPERLANLQAEYEERFRDEFLRNREDLVHK